MAARLVARAVVKRFGAVTALAGAELEVRAGEVHALVGANGCGKSTLCKIIAGSVAPDAGALELDGRPLAPRGPHDAREAGVGLFYQELSLVPALPVAENLFLGAEPRDRLGRVDRPRLIAESRALLDGLAAQGVPVPSPTARVADLAPDERQLLELLKVLAGKPRLLLLDEATAALDSKQVAAVFARVRALAQDGCAVLLISHRLDEVFAAADRVTVMRDGRCVATLEVAATTPDEVVRLMVGEVARAGRAAPAGGERRVRLSAKGLRGHRLAGVSFALREGEILGLGGLHGQGQSSLLRTLFGAALRAGGSVTLDGQPYAPHGPRQAVAAGVAYASGDRVRDGVLAARPIREHFAAVLRDPPRWLSPRALDPRFQGAARALALRFAGFDAPITSLSGGNQQKVLLGRWLTEPPRVLLLDDPAKGIDLAARTDLYRLLRTLAAEGLAILLYSSDDAELLEHADRVLVMNGGRITAELAGERLDRFELTRAAYGEASA